jgi:hypothetical protein
VLIAVIGRCSCCFFECTRLGTLLKLLSCNSLFLNEKRDMRLKKVVAAIATAFDADT